MDLNILIATLGVLVAALAEARAILRDKHQDQIRPIGLSLLQLLKILDDIINTGERLVVILAETPIDSEHNKTSILLNKSEILHLLDKQSQNFQSLADVYESKLSKVGIKAPKLGDAIEFMVADEVKRVSIHKKGTYLKILTWKLLDGELPFSRISIAARSALKTFEESTEVNHKVGYLTIRAPEKVRVREIASEDGKITAAIEHKDFIEFDLTKSSDLRRLLEKGKNQLQEIRDLREKISQFILQNVSITDLVKA